MGSYIKWEGEVLKIDNCDLNPVTLNMTLVRNIRSSVLLIIRCYSFGKVSLGIPGAAS